MATGIRIDGLKSLQKMLGDIAPREAHNISRNAIHAIAGDIAKAIREAAPVRTGNLKKSVKVKRGRGGVNHGYSDVIFTEGKNAAHDGYYWRFIEHGTQGHAIGRGSNISTGTQKGKVVRGVKAQPFVEPVVSRFSATMSERMRKAMGIALEKALVRKARRLAKRAG